MSSWTRSPAVQRKRISAALGFQVTKRDFDRYCKALEERGLTVDEALESREEFEFLRLWFQLHRH